MAMTPRANRWVEAGSAKLFVPPQQQSDFDATTNRPTTAFGTPYDAAGNRALTCARAYTLQLPAHRAHQG